MSVPYSTTMSTLFKSKRPVLPVLAVLKTGFVTTIGGAVLQGS
jgi:hypothetical protein